MGPGDGVDVLKKRWLSCFCQDLNPRSSSAYPNCTEIAASY